MLTGRPDSCMAVFYSPGQRWPRQRERRVGSWAGVLGRVPRVVGPRRGRVDEQVGLHLVLGRGGPLAGGGSACRLLEDHGAAADAYGGVEPESGGSPEAAYVLVGPTHCPAVEPKVMPGGSPLAE